MMRHVIDDDAAQEIRSAAQHYENSQPGLGDSFLDQLDAAIGRIMSVPTGWALYTHGVCRCRLDRFPYAAFYRYSEAESLVTVFAVLDLRRNPRWLQKRLR